MSGQHRTQRGFTLFELLLIVVVLAILAAISVPILWRARDTSRAGAAIATLRAIGQARSIQGRETLTIQQLAAAGAIDQAFTANPAERNGYVFVDVAPRVSQANPVDGQGRHFVILADNTIRWRDDAVATETDPALGAD